MILAAAGFGSLGRNRYRQNVLAQLSGGMYIVPTRIAASACTKTMDLASRVRQLCCVPSATERLDQQHTCIQSALKDG